MSFTFENLKLSRIILHNVFAPLSDGTSREPFLSKKFTQLSLAGLERLQQRISSVLGNKGHCLQMDIEHSGAGSCFSLVKKLLDDENDSFIENSARIAELHTRAHSSRRWPGGTLVIIDATAGVSGKRCLFIIKAEKQAGFIGKEEKDTVVMDYLENLILTPQSKLYKIGAFVEVNSDSKDISEVNYAENFEAYVYDSNIQARDETKAARYFYQTFLGLRIPKDSEHKTRDFFEHTKKFISGSDMPAAEKMELYQAMYAYLKTDKSGTIQVREFAERYMDEKLRLQYAEYMISKDFPESAISKDISLIKKDLKHRDMRFSSDVKLTAPADSFNELIEVVSQSENEITLTIRGKLLN